MKKESNNKKQIKCYLQNIYKIIPLNLDYLNHNDGNLKICFQN